MGSPSTGSSFYQRIKSTRLWLESDRIFDWTAQRKSLRMAERDSGACAVCVERPLQFRACDRPMRNGALLASRLHVSAHGSIPHRDPPLRGLWDCRRPYSRVHLEDRPDNRIGTLSAVASISSSPVTVRSGSLGGEYSIYLGQADAELPLDVGNGSPAGSGRLALASASNPGF